MVDYDGEQYYTLAEAMEKMGVSRSFLHKLRKERKISFIQDDRKIWITGRAIKEYFDKYTVIKKAICVGVPKA